MAKTMTLRLDDEQAATLELVARTDSQNLNDTLRSAIDTHIAQRRKDKDFMDRLRKQHDDDRALYERLAR